MKKKNEANKQRGKKSKGKKQGFKKAREKNKQSVIVKIHVINKSDK